jgi:hypothetical protein
MKMKIYVFEYMILEKGMDIKRKNMHKKNKIHVNKHYKNKKPRSNERFFWRSANMYTIINTIKKSIYALITIIIYSK